MKLGKSLIITGLLFSSVLGSVNVNNITAMAAEVTPPATTKPDNKEEKVPVIAKYMKGKDDVTAELKAADSNVKTDFQVDKTDKRVALKDIYLPANYVVVSNTDIIADTENKVVEIPVKSVTPIKVDIKFVDKDNNLIEALKEKTKTVDKTNIDTKISLSDFDVPTNYEFDGNPDLTINEPVQNGNGHYTVNIKVKLKNNKGNQTNKPGKGHKGHSGYALQRVRISFIDQDGDEVGYKQLNGKDTFSSKIEVPAGYTLVNSSDATIKFNKRGNKDIKIKVTKNRPTPVMEKGIVTTNSGLYFHLYTIDGKEITNRGLSGDSKWFTDQYATINGEKMFRVATNEWVKATDVYK